MRHTSLNSVNMLHWLVAMQELFLQLTPSLLSTVYPQIKTALSQTNILVKSACQKIDIVEIMSTLGVRF